MIGVYSQEAELSVLGAVLLDPSVLSDVTTAGLVASDFSNIANQEVFAAMLLLADRGTPIDPVTVAEELRIVGVKEATGGAAWLFTLIDAVPTAVNAVSHAKILVQLASRRAMALGGQEMIQRAGTDDIEALGAETEKMVQDAIRRAKGRKGTPSLGELLRAVFANIEAMLDSGGPRGLPTGFPLFDGMIGNLRPGQFIVVGARPGVGKTAWLLNVACSIAATGAPVGVFSLEMPADELVLRMAASQSGVDHMSLLSGHVSDSEWPKLIAGASKIKNLPIVIEDEPVTLAEFRARAKFMVKEQRAKVILLDYVQLIKNKRRDGAREREVAEVSVACKEIAKELRVPIVALAQLNRNSEKRDGDKKRPQLADLRDTGSLEQDADVVAFIHRNPVADVPIDRERAEMVVAKNRHGATGIIPMRFHCKHTTFEEGAPLDF